MRLHVTCSKPADGWQAVTPEVALDWLPAAEPIQRIYVPDLLELTGLDLVQTVLETWWNHPQVSVQTLLVLTSAPADVPDLIQSVRPAGWGIACHRDIQLLRFDRWPLPRQLDGKVASLCRAIK